MTDGMKQDNEGALIMIKYLVIYEKFIIYNLSFIINNL